MFRWWWKWAWVRLGWKRTDRWARSKAAEGRTHSRTLPRILEQSNLAPASWSAAALRRFCNYCKTGAIKPNYGTWSLKLKLQTRRTEGYIFSWRTGGRLLKSSL